MRKQSCFRCNQSGFFLPYVLSITVIIMFVVVTQINLYQQEIQLTHQHMEQLRIETLAQMAYQKFQEDYPDITSNSLEVHYSFPSGTVTVRYKATSDKEYNLSVDVLTLNHSAYATSRMIFHEDIN